MIFFEFSIQFYDNANICILWIKFEKVNICWMFENKIKEQIFCGNEKETKKGKSKK